MKTAIIATNGKVVSPRKRVIINDSDVQMITDFISNRSSYDDIRTNIGIHRDTIVKSIKERSFEIGKLILLKDYIRRSDK